MAEDDDIGCRLFGLSRGEIRGWRSYYTRSPPSSEYRAKNDIIGFGTKKMYSERFRGFYGRRRGTLPVKGGTSQS